MKKQPLQYGDKHEGKLLDFVSFSEQRIPSKKTEE